MQESQTVRDPAVQRLVDAGLRVLIDGNYLIVENVPYLSAINTVSRADLISAYQDVSGQITFGDHQVWSTGSVPCAMDGGSLLTVMVSESTASTIAGRQVQCRFSHKPIPLGAMQENIYNKMMHYIRKLEGYAQAVDPMASASSAEGWFKQQSKPSPFLYPNGTIVAEGLEDCESKLELEKVVIIGVGGTGSYILDAVSKVPIANIHIYDDDVIEYKNAFRMPGALAPDAAGGNVKKVAYLAAVYSSMRTGIHPHPARVGLENVNELNDSQFVFIAIDDGPSRGLIAQHLVQQGIPFIDVGIGVERVQGTAQLTGRSRTTLITPENAALIGSLPTLPDQENAVYKNIQLVEMNALNSCLAVIRFKQFFGFYADEFHPNVVEYKVAWNRIHIQTDDDQ